MHYWFVTQDPRVLDYDEHGVWVHTRFRNSPHSGLGVGVGDRAVIYEVGQNEDRKIRDGTRAVVALSKVTRTIPGGEAEGRFIELAETVLLAANKRGIRTDIILTILEGQHIDRSLFGAYILKYAGKVWPISQKQLRDFQLRLGEDDELESSYQQAAQSAQVVEPPDGALEPDYTDEAGASSLSTDSGMARYCLQQQGVQMCY